jgi:hypothetical protein
MRRALGIIATTTIIALCRIAVDAQAPAYCPSLCGHIVDQDGAGLPGVTVTVHQSGGGATSVLTETDGTFAFDRLPAGRYDVEATLSSFQPTTRRGLEFDRTPVIVELTLRLALAQQVDVEAAAPLDILGSAQPNAPITVTRHVMDVAMLPNSQFDDVLPLMPNVLRGPDGLVAIGGTRAESGALFVDDLDVSDPSIGGGGLMVPLDAVDSMQVFAGGAPAEYGGATGGTTAVHTRAGGDGFHMRADSFFPRLMYNQHGIDGVEYWDPNVGASGALVKGRVWVEQAISYRYDRNSFTTLAGPDENLFTALLSWTQIDAQLDHRQRLRVSLGVDPRATDHANITAFTPAGSTPQLKQGGWTAGISDSIVASDFVLELRASSMRTGTTVTPYGADPFVVSHLLSSGSYFDSQERTGHRQTAGATASWTVAAHHFLKAGATLDDEQLDQQVSSSAIELLRSDGHLARTVGFSSVPHARATAAEIGAYVQDVWSVRPWLTVDGAMRLDRTTAGSAAPIAPRLGWSIGTDAARTKISGTAGLFTGRIPLDVLTFGSLPTRVVTLFDDIGRPLQTDSFVNATSGTLEMPRAFHWDVQVDRQIGRWMVRARYDERRTSREAIVNPADITAVPTLETPLLLTSTGSSRSRSLETTAGFRAASGSELYVSYVRASARGDTNTLAATEGLFRTPFVQPNQYGPLPIDVPHRVLAWSIVHLPGRFTIAPFLEMRSGFPYTAVDDEWTIASAANQYRMPWMASLDLSATRVMSLPFHLPDARVGLKLYNVASVHTERAVQRDIDRPDFGARYDPIPRDFSIVFEFLWGTARHP